jgi:hypothetical protein
MRPRHDCAGLAEVEGIQLGTLAPEFVAERDRKSST